MIIMHCGIVLDFHIAHIGNMFAESGNVARLGNRLGLLKNCLA